MKTRGRVNPTSPRLIVCEGKADQQFFQQLIKVRGLVDVEVASPDVGGGGVSKFGAFLKALELSEGFLQGIVKLVIVVADNDRTKSFNAVCREIRLAGYNAPTHPKVIVQTMGKPAITVLMVPDASPGCLETLCVEAAYRKWPTLRDPLEEYLKHTVVPTWYATKQDKSRIECLLASTSKPRPQVALHDHWQQDVQYQIPVDDVAFDPVFSFITSPAVSVYV